MKSALGFTEAMEFCDSGKFDLILMGHSIPQKDKRALVAQARKTCGAPVLSIRRHGDPPLAEADFSVDSQDGPGALLDAVQQILGL